MSDALKSKLGPVANNFVAVLLALSYLAEIPKKDLGKDRTVIVSPDGFKVIRGRPKPGQVGDGDYVSEFHLGTPEGRNLLVNEPAQAAIRMLILESCETVKDHCAETEQADKLRRQPWYHYARLLRNALTHNRRWSFNDRDRKFLPLTWNGRAINASMKGQEIGETHADWYQALELHSAMVAFAETLPK